jgi:hypothetical protein
MCTIVLSGRTGVEKEDEFAEEDESAMDVCKTSSDTIKMFAVL